MSRKRSLPSINVATFEKLQQEDPAQSIENYLCSVDSNLDVGISFNGITRKSKKQVEKGLTYSFQVLFEKRTRLLSRFQRILIANITVNLMSLSRQRMASGLTKLIKVHLHLNTLFIITFNITTKFVKENLQSSQKVRSHQHRVFQETPVPVPS